MADFTPITTQEEFNTAIGERLKKERSKFDGYMSPDEIKTKYEGYMSPDDVQKKYQGYMSPDEVEAKYKGYVTPEEAAEKDKKIKGYEADSLKLKIALETGIPYELAGKLSGETEDDIRADAKVLAAFVSRQHGAPGKSNEPDSLGDPKNDAYKKLIKSMKGE